MALSQPRSHGCPSGCSRADLAPIHANNGPVSRRHSPEGYRGYRRSMSPHASRFAGRHSPRRYQSSHYRAKSHEEIRPACSSRSGCGAGYSAKYYGGNRSPSPSLPPPLDPYREHSAARIPSAHIQNDPLCSTHPSATQFKVVLDVRQFNPEDLTVKTCGKHALIQAIRTEDKGRKGVVVKEFTRRYLLPDGSDTARVSCVLTDDGYLTVEVPLRELTTSDPERVVPITLVSGTRSGTQNGGRNASSVAVYPQRSRTHHTTHGPE